MEWIGLLRSMQPVLMSAFMILVVLSLLYFVFRYITAEVDDESVKISVRRFGNILYGVIVLCVVAGVLIHGFQVMAANRMPRSDITPKSGVFEQMEKNQQQGQGK